MTEQDQPTLQGPQRIECTAARDPAVRLFIFAAMMIGFGLWTAYDAYVAGRYPYPEPYELNKYLSHLFNHYTPFVLIPAGLVAAGLAIRHLRRVLAADAEGIGYVGGRKVAWNQIRRLDGSRLKDKGILYLEHGQAERLTLDSWKLRDFKALVSFVEEHVPADARAPIK